MTERTWFARSSGSLAVTFRILWFRQLWTGWDFPKTLSIALRNAFEPSMTNK